MEQTKGKITYKQEVKMAENQDCQSITREDTKCLLMCVGHKLQQAIDCKEISTTYYEFS